MPFFNYTFLPIGNFTKSFCSFTSRKAVFAREEALRIAKYWPHKMVRLRKQLSFTKVMTNDLTPRSSPVPDTLKLLKNRNFAGMLLSFYGFWKYEIEIL